MASGGPYVPPKPERAVRSSPDKIIDIFDGMTLVELEKRTGEGIDTLQDIFLNIGEQVSLEFQPIMMDVAELTAMMDLVGGYYDAGDNIKWVSNGFYCDYFGMEYGGGWGFHGDELENVKAVIFWVTDYFFKATSTLRQKMFVQMLMSKDVMEHV